MDTCRDYVQWKRGWGHVWSLWGLLEMHQLPTKKLQSSVSKIITNGIIDGCDPSVIHTSVIKKLNVTDRTLI